MSRRRRGPAAGDRTWSRSRPSSRAVTDSTYHIWLEPCARELDGDTLVVAAPDARPHLGRRPLRRVCYRRAQRRSSGPRSPCEVVAASTARAPGARAPDARPRPDRRLQPQVHVRPVRHRRRQPPRPRRRPRRRRAAGPGLQPALRLRAARASARPTSSTSVANYLRDYGSGVDGPLHDRRGTSPTSSSPRSIRWDRAVQAPLPRRRRPADRRRPVPESKARPRRSSSTPSTRSTRPAPARPDLRPPAARPRRARGPAARALRVRTGHRHPPARPRTRITILRKRVAHDGVALADDQVVLASSPSASSTTCARSRARSSASSPTAR